MAGYVPKNATVMRTVTIFFSLMLALYFSYYHPYNTDIAFSYFIISEILYIGFITVILSENGLRHFFYAKWNNENDAYKAFEAILGFLFFHNAVSIGYIASSTPGNLLDFLNHDLMFVIVTVMFLAGFLVKILAAKVVSIEIYYWKDMFLGRKITDFVVSGPYKYLNNPMYGIGQLQSYAIAIWYGSFYGLMAAALNQILIFSFYYFIERKFIKRVYMSS
jgi:protein-S-isoprenylcysteine O-methyltransferase Ste14